MKLRVMSLIIPEEQLLREYETLEAFFEAKSIVVNRDNYFIPNRKEGYFHQMVEKTRDEDEEPKDSENDDEVSKDRENADEVLENSEDKDEEPKDSGDDDESEESFRMVSYYRLAIGVNLTRKNITVLKAYETLRRTDISMEILMSLRKSQTKTDELFSVIFGLPIKAEETEHPLHHLKAHLPIPEKLQKFNVTCFRQYRILVGDMYSAHKATCTICRHMLEDTYFATICLLRLIKKKMIDLTSFPEQTDEEIWDLLSAHENTINTKAMKVESFKEFYLRLVENRFLQNNMEDYCDSAGIKTSLLEYLQACCREFKPYSAEELKKNDEELVEKDVAAKMKSPQFHTPYVTLVQSSGVGKTRTVKELANDVILVYLCLRDPNHTGDPDRSFHADYFDTIITTGQFKIYYLSFFEVYFQWIDQQFKSEIVQFEDLRSFLRTSFNYFGKSQEFWLKLQSQYDVFSKHEPLDYSVEMNKRVERIRLKISLKFNIQDSQVPMFLFAYDEASSLLVNRSTDKKGTAIQFLHWRQALKYMPAGKCFSVLLDTSSKVSNFVPSRYRDPSARIKMFGHLLFPAFYWISFRREFLNMSVQSNKKYEKLLKWCITISGRDSKIIIQPFLNVMSSRAMFVNRLTVLLDSENHISKFEKIQDFACQKFIGGLLESLTKEQELSFRSAIAACLLDSVPLDSDLNENLVANHMATLYYVSPDRTFFSCKYVSEPVIGAAAASFLSCEKEFSGLAEEIRHRLAKGELGYLNNTGNVGEILTCISLLYSNFVCFKSRYKSVKENFEEETKTNLMPETLSYEAYRAISPPVPLLDFLEDICPDLKKETFSAIFRNAFIQFHRWIRLRDEDIIDKDRKAQDCFMSKRSLLEAFQSHCAIILPPQFPAIDLAIPIAFSNKSSFEAEEINMTYIGIQVKSWKNSLCQSVRSGCHKAMASVHGTTNVEGPKVLMLVQVGPGGMGCKLDFNYSINKNELFIQIPSLKDLCRHNMLCEDLKRVIDMKMASETYLQQYFAHLHLGKLQQGRIRRIMEEIVDLAPKKSVFVNNRYTSTDAGSIVPVGDMVIVSPTDFAGVGYEINREVLDADAEIEQKSNTLQVMASKNFVNDKETTKNVIVMDENANEDYDKKTETIQDAQAGPSKRKKIN